MRLLETIQNSASKRLLKSLCVVRGLRTRRAGVKEEAGKREKRFLNTHCVGDGVLSVFTGVNSDNHLLRQIFYALFTEVERQWIGQGYTASQ